MCHFPAAVKREASVETGDTIAFLYGSSIAESAVNEVVSLRCAKKRQMRWTNKGAHLLVQVRVAVLNGDLKMREMPEPRRTRAKQKPDDRYQRLA